MKLLEILSEVRKTKKKKSDLEDDNKPTIVSSPLRGPNQDQSGDNVTNDVASYTISD